MKNNLTPKKYDEISIFLSKILRHEPEILGVTLDQEGWTNLETLVRNFNEKIFFKIKDQETKDLNKFLKKFKRLRIEEFYIDDFKEIFNTDGKTRYFERGDFKEVRCVQGHSHPSVKITYPKYQPEGDLYHGTSPEYLDSILKNGILPQSRHYVHLSKDIETAKTVGKRHSGHLEPVILIIDKDSSVDFSITPNGIVQALHVAPEFIKIYKK